MLADFLSKKKKKTSRRIFLVPCPSNKVNFWMPVTDCEQHMPERAPCLRYLPADPPIIWSKLRSRAAVLAFVSTPFFLDLVCITVPTMQPLLTSGCTCCIIKGQLTLTPVVQICTCCCWLWLPLQLLSCQPPAGLLIQPRSTGETGMPILTPRVSIVGRWLMDVISLVPWSSEAGLEPRSTLSYTTAERFIAN
jgi:hypothetical protein